MNGEEPGRVEGEEQGMVGEEGEKNKTVNQRQEAGLGLTFSFPLSFFSFLFLSFF